MNKTNACFYDNDYLKSMTLLANEIKARSYKMLNINRGNVIADLGCGNGHDTRMLSNEVGEDGLVFGVDHNGLILSEAIDESIKKCIKNIQYFNANLEDIPIGDLTCDSVRIERVFQHLSDPLIVMKEINRILKHNGNLVVVETDWLGLRFFTNDIDNEKKFIEYLVNKKLNNGNASNRLIEYMHEFNFSKIEFEIVPFVLNSFQMANLIVKIEEVVKESIEMGYDGAIKLQEWIKKLKILDENEMLRGKIDIVLIKGEKQNL